MTVWRNGVMGGYASRIRAWHRRCRAFVVHKSKTGLRVAHCATRGRPLYHCTGAQHTAARSSRCGPVHGLLSFVREAQPYGPTERPPKIIVTTQRSKSPSQS